MHLDWTLEDLMHLYFETKIMNPSLPLNQRKRDLNGLRCVSDSVHVFILYVRYSIVQYCIRSMYNSTYIHTI